MKKLVVLIILSTFCLNITFAFSRAKESLVIYNLSNDSITVNYELLPTAILYEGIIFDEQTIHQKVNGINISIANDLYDNQVASGQKATCISYYPSDPLLSVWRNNDAERLSAISIIDKLNAIFKSFTITDIDGNVLITLETLKEDNIRKIGDNAYPQYILEIYDKDLL